MQPTSWEDRDGSGRTGTMMRWHRVYTRVIIVGLDVLMKSFSSEVNNCHIFPLILLMLLLCGHDDQLRDDRKKSIIKRKHSKDPTPKKKVKQGADPCGSDRIG